MAINLIPQETKPKASILNLSKKLKKIAVISMITLIFSLTILIGSILILDYRINRGKSGQDNLLAQIKALELTEKKLYLIKDRVDNYNKLTSVKGTKEEIQMLSEIYQNLGGVGEVEETSLDTDKLNITFILPDSKILTRLLATMVVRDYKSLEMAGFTLDRNSGYKVKFVIAK